MKVKLKIEFHGTVDEKDFANAKVDYFKIDTGDPYVGILTVNGVFDPSGFKWEKSGHMEVSVGKFSLRKMKETWDVDFTFSDNRIQASSWDGSHGISWKIIVDGAMNSSDWGPATFYMASDMGQPGIQMTGLGKGYYFYITY